MSFFFRNNFKQITQLGMHSVSSVRFALFLYVCLLGEDKNTSFQNHPSMKGEFRNLDI